MVSVFERSSGSHPLVLDIKGNALDDGPGIRSVVFFKGCPLACVWCHNPEGKASVMELSFDGEKCIGCGRCVSVCPEKMIEGEGGAGLNRDGCSLCMVCTETCPSKALSPVGRFLTEDEMVMEVLKDRPFFEASGGGVTLSGGEPTLNTSFCGKLLARFKEEGVHTLLETCGHFNWERFEAEILPHVDTLYCDIKLMDPHAHIQHCGISNQIILKNLEKLLTLSRDGSLDFLPRIPLIPGITTTDENIGDIGAFLITHGGYKVQVMPYNPLWLSKHQKIGLNSPLEELAATDEGEAFTRFMTREEVGHCVSILEAAGLSVI